IVLFVGYVFICCTSEKKNDTKENDTLSSKFNWRDSVLIVTLERDTSHFQTEPNPKEDSLRRLVALKAQQDSVRRILFYEKLSNYAIRQNRFELDTIFENEPSGVAFKRLRFVKGQRHVVAHIQDKYYDFPILLLKQQANRWKLQYVFEGSSILTDSVAVEDLNFDGIKDISIRWHYSAGRCNCLTDCYTVYLYNVTEKQLVKVPLISRYLDVAFSKREKAVYLGNHCSGGYTKYRWRNYKLVPVEEYEFGDKDNYYFYDHSEPCLRRHYVYANNRRILKDTTAECQLPVSWEKAVYPNQ
nr:hypothetical protein [Cytophagales bacterium]